MSSTSPIGAFSKELLVNTSTFTAANLVLWGTRAITHLNCPASPIGMAVAGVIQGVLLSLANTVLDVDRPLIKIAITVGTIALGAFAAFLLAKPLAVYIGVMTVQSAIASTVLCSLIRIISSYAYRYFFPPLHEKINKMTEKEFSAFLEDLKNRKDLSEFWKSLPLLTRYAICIRIIKEERQIDSALEKELFSMPFEDREKLEQLPKKDFQELVKVIIQNKDKKERFWKRLGCADQNEIWRRSRGDSRLPIPNKLQDAFDQDFISTLPNDVKQKAKTFFTEVYLGKLDVLDVIDFKLPKKNVPVPSKDPDLQKAKQTCEALKTKLEKFPESVSKDKAVQQTLQRFCQEKIEEIETDIKSKLALYENPKAAVKNMSDSDCRTFLALLVDGLNTLSFLEQKNEQTSDWHLCYLRNWKKRFLNARFVIYKRINELRYFKTITEFFPTANEIKKMSKDDFEELVEAITSEDKKPKGTPDKNKWVWTSLPQDIQQAIRDRGGNDPRLQDYRVRPS